MQPLCCADDHVDGEHSWNKHEWNVVSKSDVPRDVLQNECEIFFGKMHAFFACQYHGNALECCERGCINSRHVPIAPYAISNG